jgi:phosphatidylinositol dimannoside acyltransferase
VTLFRRLKTRLAIRGVFWRHFIRWASHQVPHSMEPVILIGWALMFFLVWAPGRRAVARNLSSILPGSSRLANTARAFRVFWNFGYTFTDTIRFGEQRPGLDWEFCGTRHLAGLVAEPGGAIVLTAHMGNYDLGSFVFNEQLKRSLTIVRAPEPDSESEEFQARSREKAAPDGVRVHYSTGTSTLALDLLHALSDGEIVAIQGDRMIGGVSGMASQLFGEEVDLPTGPFALAMATGVPIYPLFIVRTGRRRYRVTVCEPIQVRRTGPRREEDLRRPLEQWREILERNVREYWHQWFTFVPFMKEASR